MKSENTLEVLTLARKKELLTRLIKQQKNKLFPLSFAQERIWFVTELSDLKYAYNTPVIFRIKGKVDPELLQKAITLLIKRHEIFRTRIITQNGIPRNCVSNKYEFSLKIQSDFVQNDMEKKKKAELDKYLLHLAQQELDQNDYFNWRIELIPLTENESILAIVFHHVFVDGWSMNVFCEELMRTYFAVKNGIPDDNEVQTGQFSDYVFWQRNEEQLKRIQAELKYWKNNFLFENTMLNLPVDHPRPLIPSFRGKKLCFCLNKNMTKGLKDLACKQEVTLFIILLSLFKSLLYQYTEQEHITIGTPIANRQSKQTDKIIGLLMDTALVQTRFSGDETFLTLVKKLNKQMIEIYKNQSVPLNELLKLGNSQRNAGFNPLFQVMFIMQSALLKPFTIQEFTIIPEQLDNSTSKFDLTLEVLSVSDEIQFWFEYSTDLFTETTIKRMVEHFNILTENVLTDPGLPVLEYSVLTKTEELQLLEAGNECRTSFPQMACVHEMIARQAELSPHKTAIVFENAEISYRELNEKANALAHYLKKTVKTRETLIGIYFERSIEMVVSLLAVLKAGLAYVPIDPHFPEQRIALILREGHIRFLLSQENYADKFSEQVETIIDLDRIQPDLQNCPCENPDIRVPLHNLAYTIFTSGSTGVPKGVQIEHLALSNFLMSMAKRPGINSDNTLLSVTTISFDIAALEIFLPLLSGARLVLASFAESISANMLMEKINSCHIDVIQATPATYRLLLNAGWEGKKDLKVLCGGEALTADMVSRLLPVVSELWNMYGPTETTIWSSVARITEKDSIIGLGNPIANTEFYVLNNHLNLVPFNVIGELCIAGDGLARGYIFRDDLTKEKFPENVDIGPTVVERLYRTGDLVRVRQDRTIEYIGRKDFQVKIRGFRIELGDIESILQEHPQISECVVVPRQIINSEESLVAYCISHNSPVPETDNLRQYLEQKLPGYMIPSFFVFLSEFPLTPNNKIDRKVLPEPELNKKALEVIKPVNEIEGKVYNIWKKLLKRDSISREDNFFDLGGTSLTLGQLHYQLTSVFSTSLKLMDLFKYVTVESQAGYIQAENKTGYDENQSAVPVMANMKKNTLSFDSSGDRDKLRGDIAVIGISGRFAGADNCKEYWHNLCLGRELITHFSDEELIQAGVKKDWLSHPDYVKSWGALANIDLFDAGLFSFNPREAEILDPQQRIFLEECFLALGDAGYDAKKYHGKIGVFGGTGQNTYLDGLGFSHSPDKLATNYQLMIHNDKDFLATRVAYKLNLTGPCMTVQTACSTSLVAVHLACMSIKQGQTDMALAGGVSIRLPQNVGYIYQKGMILSPDGHCRAFSRDAGGTVGGNGAGVIVLKSLDQAVKDNDNIYAVIKGSAVNNDGSAKIGYTAPGIDGQQEVIAGALENAGIRASDLSYIEAHGTGTPLGDPIEIQALKQVFAQDALQNAGKCCIGSVKTNIGHLDTAAGIAGLIKTILAVRHKQIPPSLHFSEPNPKLELENSPFYINTDLQKWDNSCRRFMAGVSSFGIGGTNAHVIVAEAPQLPGLPEQKTQVPQIITLSARTEKAVNEYSRLLLEDIKNNNKALTDITFTLNTGRKEFPFRSFMVCRNFEEMTETLKNRQNGTSSINKIPDNPDQIFFLFSGQGSQYLNMGRSLYEQEPYFREQWDQCCELYEKTAGINMSSCVYPSDRTDDSARKKFNQPTVTQPGIFMLEYALARTLMHWGLKPAAMIGHSLGEYCAACISGVLSLEEMLKFIHFRAELIQGLPEGDMLAVFASAQAIKQLFETFSISDISIAAVNTPNITILSGPIDSIKQVKNYLLQKEIFSTDVQTSHAFHSVMMEPVLPDFTSFCENLKFLSPQIPYISNVTGTWITSDQTKSVEYWVKHFRETVLFSQGINELLKSGNAFFLEIGPGDTLSKLTKQHKAAGMSSHIFSCLPHPKKEIETLQHWKMTLGQLWQKGAVIDWSRYYEKKQARRISLPVYALQRERFWQEQTLTENTSASGNRKPVSDWLYLLSWKRSFVLPHSKFDWGNEIIAVFAEEDSIGHFVYSQMQARVKKAFFISKGLDFKKKPDSYFSVNPGNESDIRRLFVELIKQNSMPSHIIYFWSFKTGNTSEEILNNSFYYLFYLIKAFINLQSETRTKLIIITQNLHKLSRNEQIEPLRTMIYGPVRVAAQECENLQMQCIDYSSSHDSDTYQQEFHCCVINEIETGSKDPFVVYRDTYRWLPVYENISMPVNDKINKTKIRHNGLYLITGGLGGLANKLAYLLAEKYKAHLILLDLVEIPDKKDWPVWLNANNSEHFISQKIKEIQALENLGSDVWYFQADISEYDQVQKIISLIEKSGEVINGVFHLAGSPDTGMVMTKTAEQMQKVIKQKVQGTLTLAKVFSGKKLDFFVLFSSNNSVFGGPGQMAYCAANAYINAFAMQNENNSDLNIQTIAWDTWQDAGMSLDMQERTRGKLAGVRYSHPLISGFITDNEKIKIYVAKLSTDQWILAEHRIDGQYIVPGTCYLDLCYRIFYKGKPDFCLSVTNFNFLTPLIIQPGENVNVYLIFQQQEDEEGMVYSVSIISQTGGLNGQQWYEHARGSLQVLNNTPVYPDLDVDVITAECNKKEIVSNGEKSIYQEFVNLSRDRTDEIRIEFGKRWQNIDWMKIGDKQGIARLTLPWPFSHDCQYFPVHPALLDCAVAFLRPWFKQGVYLPLLYEKIEIIRPFPQIIYSHITLMDSLNEQNEIMNFNIRIADENNIVLASIIGFVMKKIDPADINSAKFPVQVLPGFPHKYLNPLTDFQQELIKTGIRISEGMNLLEPIMSLPFHQVFVSPFDFNHRLEMYDNLVSAKNKIQTVKDENLILHKRPELKTEYIKPANDPEKQMVKGLQELLSISGIGVEDDFFELGGNSLILVQWHKKLKDIFKINISIVDLYKYTTVRSIYKFFKGGKKETTPELAEISTRSKQKKQRYDRMRQRRSRPLKTSS